MNISIVYLSHGGKKYYDQTRFSILTLLFLLQQKQRSDVRIVVYTDDPTHVPQHDLVESIVLSQEQLQNYKGRFDYVHRIKLMVLQRANREFGTALLYVDCDTRWLYLPEKIFDSLKHGGACMHIYEGDCSQNFFPNYLAACKRYRTQLQALGLTDSLRLSMWNTGAIGTPAGAFAFYDTARAVSDYLFPRIKPRNWIEQFAFSLAGSTQYQLKELGDAVHHYWNYSAEAPFYLNEIFSSMEMNMDLSRQIEFCGNMNWNEQHLKQLQAAPEHRKQRWRNKLHLSFAKRKIDGRILLSRIGF